MGQLDFHFACLPAGGDLLREGTLASLLCFALERSARAHTLLWTPVEHWEGCLSSSQEGV